MSNELKYIPWPGWEEEDVIGSGSFGTVYKMKHNLITGVEYAALKVINVPQKRGEIQSMRAEGLGEREITKSVEQQAARILQEYTNLCELQGTQNIVRCNAVHHEKHADGIGYDIYILMELLTPLTEQADKCLRTESQIISFGIDMCSALIECERKGIIHRDIKPENIFVSKDGIYKLGDFGISRSLDHATYATVGVGTPAYMAPEVANGGEYNRQADIYSLGIVLYWLLNKRRTPFLPMPPKGILLTDRENAFKRRCSGEPLPAPINGSAKLREIVLKACAFDTKKRYQNAREMRDDLLRLSGQNSWEEETVGPVYFSAREDCANNSEQTVGPAFKPAPVVGTDKLEKCNRFIPITQNKNMIKNITLGVVAALLVLSILCSFLFSDKDTELISAEQTIWNNEEQDISPLIDRTPKEETFSSDTNKDFVMNGLNAEIDEDPVPTDAAKETTKSNSKYADIEDKINNTKLVHKPENLYDEPIAYIVVSKEGVIRSGCGTDYQQIGGVIQGDTVYVYAKRGTWFFIENEKGIIGWAGFKMVKKE